MSVTLGDAIVYIRGDDGPLGQDLRAAEGKTKSWAGGMAGNVLKTVGGAIVGGVTLATGAIVGLGAKAVNMGADAEEMLSKFGVTFGAAGDGATKALDDFSDATGRNRYELMTMAADLGSVMKGMGLTEDQAADMSVGFSQLAVDVGSFNNLQSTEVAEKYRAALSGEYEGLKSLGVVLNSTMVEQELLNMGIEDGAKAATQAELVQARYNLIMAASADAMGDAERTAGSWTNQMVALKSGISETMTEIGLKLLPVLTPLLTMFGELASQYLPLLVAALGPFIEQIGQLVGFLLAGDLSGALSMLFSPEVAATILAIKDAILLFWQGTLQPFIEEWVTMQDVVIVAIGAVAAFLLPILASIIASMLPVILVIGAAIAIVALLRNAWENNWGDIQGKTKKATEFLRTNISKALAAISAWWDAHGAEVMAIATALWEQLQAGFGAAFEWISGVVSAALEAISAWWGAHGEQVMAIVGALWEGVQKAMSTAIDVMKSIFQAFRSAFEGDWVSFGSNLRDAWDAVWELIRGAVDAAVAHLKGIDWKGIGKGIVQGVINGVESLIDSLVDTVVRMAEAAYEAATGFFKMGSPSKLMMEVGKNVTLGLADGIADVGPAELAMVDMGRLVASAAGAGAVDRSQHHVYNLYPRNDGQQDSMRNYVRMLQTLQEVA